MARARQDKDPEPEDAEDEASAAREFLLARLAICQGELSCAQNALNDALQLFSDPSDDAGGKQRATLLEVVDASLGAAARAVQLAMPALKDYDPKEQEPDDEDDDE